MFCCKVFCSRFSFESNNKLFNLCSWEIYSSYYQGETLQDLSVLENEQTNASHSVPVAPVPDPGRLIPVQVPIQKVCFRKSFNFSGNDATKAIC